MLVRGERGTAPPDLGADMRFQTVPQRQRRHAPRALVFAAGFCSLLMGWKLFASDQPAQAHPAIHPETVSMTLSPAAGAAAQQAAAGDPDDAAPDPVRGLKLRQIDETVRHDQAVAQGRLSGSAYDSMLAAGAPAAMAAELVRLLAHRLDLARDIKDGDSFRVVYDRQVTDAGRVLETGRLLYAEIGGHGRFQRFYRYQPDGADRPDFFDADGRSIHGFLLRTPLDGARMTSGFGLRLHPLLGYTRMHEGVDFGAAPGSKVLAAGDGVVEEARWDGGYGRWLKIRHDADWETGYAHLSGWAVKVGDHVRQGQVVGFVGASGLATGPHLHFEVMKDGEKVNPNGAKAPQGIELFGRDLAAFTAERGHIDDLLADAASRPARLAEGGAQTAAGLTLRAALR